MSFIDALAGDPRNYKKEFILPAGGGTIGPTLDRLWFQPSPKVDIGVDGADS